MINLSDIDNQTFSWNPSPIAGLLDKIDRDKPKLEKVLELITGVAVNATREGKAQFIKESKHDDNHYPLLEGGYSIPKPYAIPQFKSYINYDKSLESTLNDEFDENYFKTKGSHQRPFNLRKVEDFDRPKIFIRQSDIRVTATFSVNLLFGNYSLFTVYLDNDDSNLLKAYLAILNSKLISFYAIHKEIVLIKDGKTPQLRSGQRGPIGVRQLPLVLLSKSARIDLCDLVDKIYDNQIKNLEINVILNKIDDLVFGLYGLEKEEIEMIKNA